MSSQIKPVKLRFYLTPAHACPYLPEQSSQTLFLSPEVSASANLYSHLLHRGFRRSGDHIYRPHCEQCQACISVRIPVARFQQNNQQKRCFKRKNQFRITLEPAKFNQDHYQLFAKYIEQRHADGDMYPPSEKQFQEFLLSDWLNSQFLSFYHIKSGKLIACCVFDQVDHGLSAVYTYFDPEFSRYSPGRLAILQLVEEAKRQSLDYVYLGYWIKQSPKMAYKGEYRPLECFVNESWVNLS